MNDIIDTFKKTLDFEGRSNRRKFWTFWGLNVSANALGLLFNQNSTVSSALLVVTIVLFVPYCAVAIRRVHDIGKTGIFAFIPFYNLYLFTKTGDSAANKFGPPDLG